MSDLSALLGGTAGAGQASQAGDQTDAGAADQQKKKRSPVKPDAVLRKEKVTGITAEWSDAERRWVFPGMSTTMGGPKAAKAKTGEPQADQAQKTQDDPALAAVAHLMENQKWSDAWLEISKLDEKKYAGNKGYIQMKQLIKNKAGL